MLSLHVRVSFRTSPVVSRPARSKKRFTLSSRPVSKIIRNLGDQVNGEALLPRWVAALPVFVDPEEMSPVYGLLLELIARLAPPFSPFLPSHPPIVY